jgi:hypothetical protein
MIVITPICIFVLRAFQISTIFFARAQTHHINTKDVRDFSIIQEDGRVTIECKLILYYCEDVI